MQWRIPWQSADTLARYPRIPRTDISGYRWLDPAAKIHYQGIPAQYPVLGGKIDSDNVHAINLFCLSCITSQSQRGTLFIQNGPIWRILNLESYNGSNEFFSSIGEGLAILISERGGGHIDIKAKRRPPMSMHYFFSPKKVLCIWQKKRIFLN